MQAQELAIRVTHEARSYEDKYFLTLTYDDEHRPGGLKKRDIQLFWKRVRRASGQKLKYLTCGEYGDRTRREHYHAAVLGLPITDLKAWDSTNNRSATLERLWGNGIVTVSELTDARIRYVAGYVLKKAGYKKQIYCDEDGEELEAPFRLMSQGLGKRWAETYANDLRLGYLQHNGAKYSIPRYYKDKIKKEKPELNEQIENQKYKNYKRLSTKDLELLRNAEKIRQKDIKNNTSREQI